MSTAKRDTTSAAPPKLRIESHDWIFVGYTHPDRANNAPPQALHARTLAEVAPMVTVYLARVEAEERYPYIFLAPALAKAFTDQVVAAELAHAVATFGWPPEAWDAVVDFTAHRAWHADMRMGKPKQGPPLSITGAGLSLDLQAAISDAVHDWGHPETSPPTVTARDIYAAAQRTRLTAALHPADQFADGACGWTIVVAQPEGLVDVRYRTPGGAKLVPYRTYRELERQLESRELPLAADQLYEFMRERHDDRDDYCEAFPSKRAVGEFIKREGLSDPAPPVVRLRSVAELVAGTDTQAVPRAVLPYLAWLGRLILLAMREKDGKSTLVGSGVAALTTGRPWLGQPTSPVTVLWFSEESQQDFTARLQHFGADLTRVFYVPLPLSDPERELAAACAQVQPGLIVIDSLIRYTRGRVTSDTSASQWADVLTPLATRAHAPGGPAILLLHHAGKRDGEYRDSTEIGAAVDLLIQGPKGRQRNRQTLEAAGRIVGLEPYTITVELVGAGHQLVRDERRTRATKAVAKKDQAVLAALVGTMTHGAWFEASGLRSKGTLNRAIARLLTAKAVERTGDGQYCRTEE